MRARGRRLGRRVGDLQDTQGLGVAAPSPTIIGFAFVQESAMAIYQLGDDAPRIAPSAWVADSAR